MQKGRKTGWFNIIHTWEKQGWTAIGKGKQYMPINSATNVEKEGEILIALELHANSNNGLIR